MAKIAVDSGPLTSGDSLRGIGTYTRELLKALNMEGVDTSKEDLSKFDVVHFTRFNPFRISLPFTKPKNTKFVLTIYDLIPLIYPKNYPSGIKGWFKWQINKFLIKSNVDAIITISETSKKDICRFLGVDPKMVFVTYLAPREIFKKVSNPSYQGLPKRFAFYVGDANYNKNIGVLVEACKIANIPLVIAGKQAVEVEKMDLKHPELSHLKRIDWLGVIRLGYVSDSDLVKIYNLAAVYVQPSLYEGFGLPVLEALACGTPTVATKTQCLVEVLGDNFKYVDPKDPKDMASGILDPNLKFNLPRVYSWERTAKETMEVYNS
jgi:glycosyltransferase involved in cell wall biosynthesis